VSGKFRRRKLLASPGMTTRPITDRVKEALFERLEDDLQNNRIADASPAPVPWV
jgi:16S rRNA G966 N2-methylase RsmD